MGVIAESPVVGILEAIGQPLAVFGIPNPLYDKVMEADFEQTPSQEQAAAITAGLEIIRAATAQFSGTVIDDTDWGGEGRDRAGDVEDCTVSYFEMLGDMYIMLLEIIVQVIDYLIDIIRWIVKLCEILLGVLLAIVAVAVGFSVITAGGSLAAGAAAAATALGTTFWVMVSFIAAIAVIGSILVWAIDLLIEWLQDTLAAAREKGCLKGEAPLPDWDPTPPSTPW